MGSCGDIPHCENVADLIDAKFGDVVAPLIDSVDSDFQRIGQRFDASE